MTPAEYRAKADEILETRKLETYQYWDLITQCKLVEQRGCSTSLDDFYLEIVGVPMGPRKLLPGWGLPKVKKAEQGRLF